MKKFSINCDFGGQMAPFDFYIGQPEKEHHPLHFQADWLSKQRGGTVPAEVMTAIAKLKDIAEKNSVSLEDLCVYAIGSWDKEEGQPVAEENTDNRSNTDEQNGSETEDVATENEMRQSESGEDVITNDLDFLDNKKEIFEEEIVSDDEALSAKIIKTKKTPAKKLVTKKIVKAKKKTKKEED